LGDRQVGESEPQRREQQHGSELHALGESADDQRHGDGGESSLKCDEDELGDNHAFAEGRRIGHTARGRIEDAFQEQPVKAADERIALGERQRIAVDRPKHGNQRENAEHLHQDGQHVLAAHQAAVEQRQARDGHHDDQQRRHQHPGGIALVRHGCRDGSNGYRFGGNGGCGSRGCHGFYHGRSGCRLFCKCWSYQAAQRSRQHD